MQRKRKYFFMSTIPKKRRLELEAIINDFNVENEDFQTSGDIVEALRGIGFIVNTASFVDNLDGMILVDENSRHIENYKSNKLIFVNQNKDLYESRFIVMHELAHYIEKWFKTKQQNKLLGNDTSRTPRGILLATRDHGVGYSNDLQEQEKDYMAAALLVPKDKFLQNIKNYLEEKQIQCNKSTIESLKDDEYFLHMSQNYFKVEEKLIIRRLEEIAEYEDYE